MKIVSNPARIQISGKERLVDMDDVESITETITVLEDVLIVLKEEIGKAQALKFKTGKHADPMWYQRTNAEIRYYQLHVGRLQARRGTLHRSRKIETSISAARFIEIARRRLNPEVFDSIYKEAQEEV